MVEKNKDRTCSTCEHKDLEGYKEPCRSCRWIHGNIFTNYTPKKRIKRYPAVSEEILEKFAIYCDNDVRATEAISTLGINFPKIERVMFNGPATIVFWQDDTKTVVKCREGDTFDPEKGIAMAIAKKVLGNEDGYYEGIKKWLPKEKKKREPRILKGCSNCRYRDVSACSDPCRTCVHGNSFTNWEPKEQISEKEEETSRKWCGNCRYRDVSSGSKPCFTCIFDNACRSPFTKWEPKEKTVEKTCETCRYNPCSYGFSLVCSLCNDYEYWEPKN